MPSRWKFRIIAVVAIAVTACAVVSLAWILVWGAWDAFKIMVASATPATSAPDDRCHDTVRRIPRDGAVTCDRRAAASLLEHNGWAVLVCVCDDHAGNSTVYNDR